MFTAVLETILVKAGVILQQTAIQEHIRLQTVGLSLLVAIVLLLFSIRFLAKAPKSFADRQTGIPDEVLIRIFENLSIRDLKSCSLVCRQFERVSKDEKLWRKFCERDWKVKDKSERPVWIASWHDYYVYRFKDITALNIKIILWKYWKFFLQKNGYHLQAFIIAFSPLIVATMVIIFVHNFYDNHAIQTSPPKSPSDINSHLSIVTTSSNWEMPSCMLASSLILDDKSSPFLLGETCIWIMLIKIATFILVHAIIPIVAYFLSWVEPLFIKLAIHVFGSHDYLDSKYLEEHKSTAVLLGATLLTVTLLSAVISLLSWRLIRFARSEWRQRRVKFIANLKKGWDEVEKKTRLMRRRIRNEIKKKQQQLLQATNRQQPAANAAAH